MSRPGPVSRLIPKARLESVDPEKALRVESAYSGETIAEIAVDDSETLERHLREMSEIVKKRAYLSRAKRLEILERTAIRLTEAAEDFAQLIALEGGKPLRDARKEAARAADGLRACGSALRGQRGEEVPVDDSGVGRIAFTSHEPIGIVAAISAFNHPLNLAVHQIGPALAAGCPFLIKPAAHTPLSSIALLAAMRESGLPELHGDVMVLSDRKLSQSLASDPRVAFLSFIGSANVGWGLRSTLAQGTRCALEHGGLAPVIVAEDADIPAAATALSYGAYYHAGQVCVSVQRIFVQEEICGDFARAMQKEASRLLVGDPMKPETQVGPLIRPREVERVHSWVREALEGGGDLICGGNPISARLYPPTLILNPRPDSKLMRQEVFGPVAVIVPYAELDEAIAMANDTEFSFQAAVWTSSLDTAMRAYAGLESSAVMVNEHSAFRVDDMPFAGWKKSGYGVGGVSYTMREMSREKLCVIRSDALAIPGQS